jgi:uncharacterized protein
MLTISSLALMLISGNTSMNISEDYPIQPVPFTSVHVNDNFWAPRIETNRAVTIRYAFKQCEDTGRIANFEHAAETLAGEDPTGKPLPGYPFDDTDVYKVMEGASYCLSIKPDSELDAYLDGLIKKIAAAQEPDGYLYPARTINPTHPHDWSGKERWINEQDQSHELYNSGHLYEAAVAHFQATGKKNFLDIATKNADLLVKTFGPGKRSIWPGHEIIEMGLAKLYRATGKKEYLDLAKFMIECRHGGGDYWQAHLPVLQQTEAVGHAVRATYLYSGVADVAALTSDAKYVSAIDTLWDNVVDKKLYITGGIGAQGSGEAFGPNYFLPNASAYAETCAAVGNDYWNQRLFLLHGESKYIDVFERTLYNGLLSGVGLDGKSFFYQNPLSSSGRYERSAWFGCACCPGNITRFIASVPGYVYAVRNDDLFVNLFVGSHAEIKMPSGGQLNVTQTTEYPWAGAIHFQVDPVATAKYTVRIRIPGWAKNEVTPSDLYAFTKKESATYDLKVNGSAFQAKVEDGYAVISRTWKKGDTVDLNLPMSVRQVNANEKVVDDQNLVAFERGPIVYCAEGHDNAKGNIQNIVINQKSDWKTVKKPDVLGGILQIQGSATGLYVNEDGSIDRQSVQLTLIPYASWANRGKTQMAVWFPTVDAKASPVHKVMPIYAQAKVSGSQASGFEAINDLHDPKKSSQAGSFMHWWPKKGTTEWVQYTFEKPVSLSESHLYWFDDTGVGECRAPASWSMSYRNATGEWVPVETSDPFGVSLDVYNTVHFKSITTTAVKIEVKLQQDWAAGIQQWKVK